MSSLDVLTLRSRIATALSGELGTYTYQRGLTSPALHVELGSQAVEEQPRVAGLEVIVNPYTSPVSIPLLGKQLTIDDVCEITLKQWDTAKSVSFALTLLASELKDLITDIGPLLSRNTALDSIEQQTISIAYQRR